MEEKWDTKSHSKPVADSVTKKRTRKPYITQHTPNKNGTNLLDNASRENFNTMGEDRKLKYPKRGKKFY